MAEWTAKRFWSDVSLEATADGFGIRLDGRPVRTPGKRELLVPTQALAEVIADEWRAQAQVIDPSTMPATRSANSALEKVAPHRAVVQGEIAGYAETDLLCYRATGPAELIARQAAAWDPLLEWATTSLDARLLVTVGVMPVDQPPGAIRALTTAMNPMSDFELTGFHDLVALSGSFVLALAVARRHAGAEPAWDLSRIDESWQAELWGADEQAAEMAAAKRAAFLHAGRFFHLSQVQNSVPDAR
ncbi:ATP12 family chaperone protein [Oceaniovalibus sp. ACAM 378]|uniref:ATP12 family chaperone protein n=1 Tax=Oceaniovalibus sp. ACAM 378 TaxID=2599923 RepID=UPI0011DB3C05|nr:ATP12 family protein [Oceaniovalibus sp. ACAM 378]TYB88491.1 ATPase [Oceaniovalibus sp. ACAM 378]